MHLVEIKSSDTSEPAVKQTSLHSCIPSLLYFLLRIGFCSFLGSYQTNSHIYKHIYINFRRIKISLLSFLVRLQQQKFSLSLKNTSAYKMCRLSNIKKIKGSYYIVFTVALQSPRNSFLKGVTANWFTTVAREGGADPRQRQDRKTANPFPFRKYQIWSCPAAFPQVLQVKLCNRATLISPQGGSEGLSL